MYEIDELASLVALANEKEQLALVEDIRLNGQQEPAVLWQERLVDGRCRQLACQSLGIPLKVRHLDSKLSREDVAKIVKSLNTRRNLTMTQKIASAYKQQLRTKETNEAIANQWAVSVPSLKNMKYIAKNHHDMVDPLFNGDTVVVEDPEVKHLVTTNKVNTLARIIKKQVELGKVVVDNSEVIEFTADGKIKTEAGKDWYYSTVKALRVEDPLVKMLLVELANLKYKLEE
jgi:uncharacterized protein YgbK (DUF1537 family)